MLKLFGLKTIKIQSFLTSKTSKISQLTLTTFKTFIKIYNKTIQTFLTQNLHPLPWKKKLLSLSIVNLLCDYRCTNAFSQVRCPHGERLNANWKPKDFTFCFALKTKPKKPSTILKNPFTDKNCCESFNRIHLVVSKGNKNCPAIKWWFVFMFLFKF